MTKILVFAAKAILWTIVVLFVLVAFGGLLPALFRFLFAILFGWIGFLGRVLPEITFNLSAIAFAVVCSGLLLWGMQRFCAWFYGDFRSRHAVDSPWPAVWPWRWTACVYCALWLLFLTSMSATGIAHQLVWLARSNEPVIESRRDKAWIQLASAANAIRTGCERSGWESQAVRRICEETLGRYVGQGESVHDRWQIIRIETRPGMTEVVFITYRDPIVQKRLGYRRVLAREVSEGKIEELARDIDSFAAVKARPAK